MEQLLEDLLKLRHTNIVEEPSVLNTGYYFDYHKDNLLIEYSNTGDIDAFLSGLVGLFHPNYCAKTIEKGTEYLYIFPVFMGYADMAKFVDKELEKLKLTDKFKEDLTNHLIECQQEIGMYDLEEAVLQDFENSPIRSQLVAHLKKKGNILSTDLAPEIKFDKEVLTKNPYARLVYTYTKSIDKVKYGDYSDVTSEMDMMYNFLTNLQMDEELSEFIHSHNFKDKETLPNWKHITNPWKILEKGLAFSDPLIFLNPKDIQSNSDVPCIVLQTMGYDIKPTDIPKWHRKELTDWYKKNNIQSIEDLENALKKEYAGMTTMSPEQINAYIETVPLLKKKLSSVKGYYLMIPHKDASQKLIVKKVTTLKEAQGYMKSKFRYECEEIVAKPLTDTFGQTYILASYNIKNRDEYFGYLVDESSAKNYDSPVVLFTKMMKELSSLPKEKMNEQGKWQVASVGNFVWCVHSREFEYKLPDYVLSEYQNGLVNALYQFCNTRVKYDNYLKYDCVTGELDTVPNSKVIWQFVGIKRVMTFATTGLKGIYVKGIGVNKNLVDIYLVGLTKKEYNQLTYTPTRKWLGMFEDLRSNVRWQPEKGRIPDTFPNKVKCGLLLNKLNDKSASGSYITSLDLFSNNRQWECLQLRNDNKQFVVSTPEGIRNYVLLTDTEYKWILKYMGVTNQKEINWSILRKKCQFFYENMEIYRELERMARV